MFADQTWTDDERTYAFTQYKETCEWYFKTSTDYSYRNALFWLSDMETMNPNFDFPT